MLFHSIVEILVVAHSREPCSNSAKPTPVKRSAASTLECACDVASIDAQREDIAAVIGAVCPAASTKALGSVVVIAVAGAVTVLTLAVVVVTGFYLAKLAPATSALVTAAAISVGAAAVAVVRVVVAAVAVANLMVVVGAPLRAA